MASIDETIVLDSDTEESNDGILIVEQISGKRSRSGMAGNDRKNFKASLFGEDIMFEGPSTSTVDWDAEVLAVLSSDVIEKRAREVDALKTEYGEDDAGWGVKSVVTKLYDQDVVSCVAISILPSLSRYSDPAESFSVVAVVGSQQEVFTSFRAFPPLRVRIDLSLQDNDAKFFVSSSWLLKEHTKRLKNEMERRYKKHNGSLLHAIEWLKEKSIKSLQILKHRQIFYGTPDAENWKPHYISFHDPVGVQLMFKSISDKVILFEGTDLSSASAFDCPICFDHKASMAAVMLPQCKHYFCRGCVSQDLSLKIKEGQLKDLKCLQHGCAVQVDIDMLKLWVDSTTFQRYCDLTTDQFLDQSTTMIRCPKKECNIPMELAQNAPREVQCLTCNHQFCATCKAAPHPGAPCLTDAQKKQIRDEWKTADEAGRELLRKRVGADNVKFALEDAESEEWIKKNAKPCPTCSTPIQKIDGCNKMVCTSKGCKTYFCWLCGKRLDDKNPYSHFSESGACNGRLHTPVGPDGQLVNPYPQFNVNVNLMGLRIGGAAGIRMEGLGAANALVRLQELRAQQARQAAQRARQAAQQVARQAMERPAPRPRVARRTRAAAPAPAVIAPRERRPATPRPATPGRGGVRRRARTINDERLVVGLEGDISHPPIMNLHQAFEEHPLQWGPYQGQGPQRMGDNFVQQPYYVPHPAAPVMYQNMHQIEPIGPARLQVPYGNPQEFYAMGPAGIIDFFNPANQARGPGAR